MLILSQSHEEIYGEVQRLGDETCQVYNSPTKTGLKFGNLKNKLYICTKLK